MPTMSKDGQFIKTVRDGNVNKIFDMINNLPTHEAKMSTGFWAYSLAVENNDVKTALALKAYVESVSSHAAPQKLLMAAKAGYTDGVLNQLAKIPNPSKRLTIATYALIIASMNSQIETANAIQERMDKTVIADYFRDEMVQN